MKKNELLESFESMEKLSRQMLKTVADVKAEMDRIAEKNAELEIENIHLRERLDEIVRSKDGNGGKSGSEGLSQSRKNLEKLYDEGFHVCNVDNMYGSRRVNDEPCVFCQDVIYGDRH